MPRSEERPGLVIFADGGSRGNPGPSAVGAVLYADRGDRIGEISKYIGETTNNVAEYLSVIYALQEASRMNFKDVTLNVDSQLIARQLKGEYRVKDRNLRIFFDLASSLIRHFDKFDIREVPREKNKEADLLVNNALNGKGLL